MKITDLIEREHGGRNWVVARRTAGIVRRYGEDVICLSEKRLHELEKQLEIENADNHPAFETLADALGEAPAVDIIVALRMAGFRIEPVPGERPMSDLARMAGL